MTAEFTDLAENADGSVILRYGNTAVLATAVMSSKTRDDIDYFPLTVDYEERFYAAGQILGSRFVRREGRPSEQAVLSGRVVDRTIRPLFPSYMRNEVQVIITILALDEEDPDTVAVNAASLALAVSSIPWNGPVAAVRIGKATDFVVNPIYKQRTGMELDILACGKGDTINMVEIAAKQVSEDDIAAGFVRAAAEHEKIVAWQQEIVAAIGKEKRVLAKPEIPTALTELYETEFAQKLYDAVFCGVPNKDAIHEVQEGWMSKVTELAAPFNPGIAKRFLENKVDEIIHAGAIDENKRADNRGFDQLRPLYAQAGGVSDILHGSGIFYRGGTHVFTALTLGGPGDSQVVDTMEEHDVQKRFMHHYNFPPYSVGETGRMGGLSRRSIGHGALAEKALLAVMPSKESFPYTIRVVSECLASNGSTSMGSVCASTLALLDGGVPIVAPVAGIAMGLMITMKEDQDKATHYKVLTDIQGPEDEFGDMDFKVAGTRNGVTAVQMDIKLDGVPIPVLVEALAGAKAARMQILDVIEKEIAVPRANISPRAPQIITMRVRPDQIGLVIGGGGKTINGIRDTTGVVDITIEDDGSIFITGSGGSAQKAQAMIEALVKEYKAGEVYDGEVTRLMDFGAFVRIGPGKDAEGLVHVSEIAPFRINKASDAVAVGDKVRVMIKEIDDKGRVNLSIKAVDPEFAARKGLKPASSSPSHTTPNGQSNPPQQPTTSPGTAE
ncbi:MAG: polyribonucleotide nucleotidyltransferase, polyribonucleotide nucleotidyltransferase [Candidatus Adlerbacteria bacterium]|nr:polyribonucleotide nucleotidyltransferase, polyribonucleotide nucleotidyltransferase [Candidatus Adlerbacteria bacterium]